MNHLTGTAAVAAAAAVWHLLELGKVVDVEQLQNIGTVLGLEQSLVTACEKNDWD
jgi:hypothetical protein